MVVTRTPPRAVLDVLREEVGFHCPADRDGDLCGSPYLTWHHFDLPWRDEQHHRPEGMIALCREHADKADHGAYTDDQLRRLKAEGEGRGKVVRGRFDWMRQDLLAIVGGNAYYQTPTLVRVGDQDTVWLNRNRYGELLLNFKMPTLSGLMRAEISDNAWVVPPDDVEMIVCPPSGRRIDVRYGNGDRFQIAFSNVSDRDGMLRVLSFIPGLAAAPFQFPLTVVLVSQEAAGGTLSFSPTKTTLGGSTFKGSFISNCQIGLHVGKLNPAS